MAEIETTMVKIKRPMAKIAAAMANITSPYGDNYLGMAEIVGVNRQGMAETTFRNDVVR
jgi:hypothetical protein